MGSLADAAGKFAEKIADVLDVFDLSFFVAGSAALGALLIWLDQHGVDTPEGLSTDRALVAVIIAYVLGLICYTLGRTARAALQNVFWKRPNGEHPLEALYRHHKLGRVADFRQYEADRGWSALYDRLWVLIRTEASLRETYVLVRRYWVLGAAYDGLAIAALLWLLPVSGLDHSTTELPAASLMGVQGLLGAGLVLGAVMSWRQAKQYHRYQISELAATAAHWANIGDGPPPGAPRTGAGADAGEAERLEDTVNEANDADLGEGAEIGPDAE